MAIGNILMLLMKPPAAQGGNAFSFPHGDITKVGGRHLFPLKAIGLWYYAARNESRDAGRISLKFRYGHRRYKEKCETYSLKKRKKLHRIRLPCLRSTLRCAAANP